MNNTTFHKLKKTQPKHPVYEDKSKTRRKGLTVRETRYKTLWLEQFLPIVDIFYIIVGQPWTLTKHFTKILGKKWSKIGINRNYLHNLRTFQFQNIVHNILLNETFQMMGHSRSSNNIKFIKILYEWICWITTFLGLLTRNIQAFIWGHFLGNTRTNKKKMNPPSAVLGGGGVHGKVCWLTAYCSLLKIKTISLTNYPKFFTETAHKMHWYIRGLYKVVFEEITFIFKFKTIDKMDRYNEYWLWKCCRPTCRAVPAGLYLHA